MLTKEKYDKLLPFMWVCRFKNDPYAIVNVHKFQVDKPPSVPNPEMDWFKPTYEQLLHINNLMMKKLYEK